MKRLLLCLAGIFLAVPLALQAQTSGTLEGTVTDENGEGIPGATVLVIGTSRGASTDVNGKFLIAGIRAGNYVVEITSIGTSDTLTRQVSISANRTTRENFQFGSTGIESEVVDYVKKRERVDPETTGAVRELTGDELLRGNTQSTFGEIAREATVNTSGGGFNIRGGRGNETSIRRDGIEITDPVTGGAGPVGINLFPDVAQVAVERVQIIASGFEAEYGDVLSGTINIVTRNGRNNRFDGILSYRTGLPFLYGSSSPITVKLAGTDKDTVLPGYKLQSSGNRVFEFGFGGYVPGIKNNTGNNALRFYLSGRYNPRTRNGGYAVMDMSDEFAAARVTKAQEVWGYSLEPTDLGAIERDIKVRNVNAKLRYDIGALTYVELGGEVGLTTGESNRWRHLYRRDHPVFSRVEDDGQVVYDTNFALMERDIQATDYNTVINRILGKVWKGLSGGSSYFELEGAWVVNRFEIGKKDESKDYGIFDLYDIPDIVDQYNLAVFDPSNPSLVPNDNGRIDIYELSAFEGDFFRNPLTNLVRNPLTGLPLTNLVRNPLTGLYEGGESPGASRNPYGMIASGSGFFPTHGNSRSLELRESTTITTEGTYETNFQLGDALKDEDNVRTKLRAGFDFAYYSLRRHENNLPWDADPFFDVYGFDATYFASIEPTGRLRDFLAQPFHPFKGAIWAQTRFDYKTIVFNTGLRFDFFNPNTQAAPLTRQRPEQLLASLDTVGDATMKFQVSPRIGISYPITDNANFRVNFAMMFKMPEMRLLYDNAYGDARRSNRLFGNPDIDPEKVVIYDLGYEARLNDNFFVDVSAFNRDIFNQSGVTYVPAVPSPYILQTVQEYGNVRGLELTLEMRRAGPNDHIRGRLNYTLQRAAGTASSPTSNYRTLIGSPDPYTGERPDNPLTEFPFTYDQTHTFNATVGFVWLNDQGPALGGMHLLENTDISFTGLYRTGWPFTLGIDSDGGEQVGEFNANRFLAQFNSEARISRTIYLSDILGESVGRTNLEIFLIVSNLFNTTGPVSFYTRTGTPDRNGTFLDRRLGDFPVVSYFDKEDPNRPETVGTNQFDQFGTRHYNPYADINLDGVVTQPEKYAGYQRYVATVQSLRGNYDQPRTFTLGMRLRF